MNRCSLCMTELHSEAIVCTGCGAQKEAHVGYVFGSLALGLGTIALLCVLGEVYKIGVVFLLAMVGVLYAAPKRIVWVRRSQRS